MIYFYHLYDDNSIKLIINTRSEKKFKWKKCNAWSGFKAKLCLAPTGTRKKGFF